MTVSRAISGRSMDSFVYIWPVPASTSRCLPTSGPGSFWEDRGDRFHCGVDIYAPLGSQVLAVASGRVVQTELFTSPVFVDYWNETFTVTLVLENGVAVRFAELQDVRVSPESQINAGTVIGHVGQVLNPQRISQTAPAYIRQLKQNNQASMLHLEVLDRFPFHITNYLGGNVFENRCPEFLLNPTEYFANFSQIEPVPGEDRLNTIEAAPYAAIP